MPEESATPDQFEIRRRVFQAASRGDVDEVLSHRIKRFTIYTDIDEARAAAERLDEERG
jgi:hypothetical protein